MILYSLSVCSPTEDHRDFLKAGITNEIRSHLTILLYVGAVLVQFEPCPDIYHPQFATLWLYSDLQLKKTTLSKI